MGFIMLITSTGVTAVRLTQFRMFKLLCLHVNPVSRGITNRGRTSQEGNRNSLKSREQRELSASQSFCALTFPDREVKGKVD